MKAGQTISNNQTGETLTMLGLPKNLLVRVIFIRTSEGFLPRVPLAVQKVVFSLAAFIASLTGVEKRLAKYHR